MMKNKFLALAVVTTMGIFSAGAYIQSKAMTPVVNTCEGEHKCDDKCKKDKEGKCSEAKADSKDAKACCKKDSKKSCHGKKAEKQTESSEMPDKKS